MCTFSDKRNAPTLAIADVTAMSGFMAIPEARAKGFVDDPILTGGTYCWQREHGRKDVTDDDKYKINLSHSIWSTNLDFQPGYATDMLSLDVAAFAAIEMAENDDGSHPNEIVFSKSSKAYGEDWSGDKSGISLYRAATKFKYGPVWARASYIRPTGQTLLTPHWGFILGACQGVGAGANSDYDDAGILSFPYVWINECKAPQHLEMDEFYQNDKTTKVDYLYSLGTKHDFKNNLVLEAAFGQTEGYVDRHFAKASYRLDIVGSLLTASYQFYGTRDRVDNHSVNNLYDGIAWLQASTFSYRAVDIVDLRLEGIWIKADGQQGYFLQCMTPTYASSNGRPDTWQDSHSDFNTSDEEAVFFGAIYDPKNRSLPGPAIGASYVYTWDAKPAAWQGSPGVYYDKNRTIEESAYSLDAVYTIQDGRAKDAMLKLRFTEYDNYFDIPSWGDDHSNIFQDEHDMKFMVITPFATL